MSEGGGAVLELDLGNTRLKWRSLVKGGVGAAGFFVRQDYPSLPACLAALSLELDGFDFSQVRVASVASAASNEALALWGRNELALCVEFARVSREWAGVVNGYDDYSLLGVDRWLAVLAAQQLAPEGACVVDCGSAVTLDLVVSGQHLGGYIVPGLRLMNAALFGSTDGVKVVAENLDGGAGLLLGRDTAGAVNLGLPMMVASLVAEVVQRFLREREVRLQVILTGGDAPAVAGFLEGAFLCRPDLVLDGLVLAEFS